MILYRLEHNHYTNGYLQNLYIGLFSSKEIAEEVMDKLIIQIGFNLHPRSCFELKSVIVDDFTWRKGFFQVGDKDTEIE